MNIQLAQVLTDITGETGLAIVRAIVAGERDGLALAQRRDPHCQSAEETFAKRSEEHTSELQSPCNLVCRLLLEKKKKIKSRTSLIFCITIYNTLKDLTILSTTIILIFDILHVLSYYMTIMT